jgi:enterobactin synthetase component D
MFSPFEINSGVTYSADLPLSKDLAIKYDYLLNSNLINAGSGRKDEFVAGRACALLALTDLGSESHIVRTHKSRRPIWPKGFVGSISHTKDFALASVFRDKDCRSVGIDCETLILPDRFENIKDYITRKEDLVFLETNRKTPLNQVQTLIFSAKEALYKAINPLCDEFFGFQDAYVSTINESSGKFSIIIDSKIEKLKQFKAEYHGQFKVTDKHIITSIEIEHNT